MAEEPEAQASAPTPTPDQSSTQKSPPDGLKQPQAPSCCGFATSPITDIQTYPLIYPALVPALFPLQQDQEQINNGAGLYAVPVLPFMGPTTGISSNTLIPFTYRIPAAPRSPETGAVGGEQEQVGQPQQQDQPPQPQQLAQQRVVVARRFQIAFQLDLLLILKLAAVIFLFNQDGSRQRLALLVFFASLIYLYQTGALAPFVRWLSQGMHRAAVPPQPPRPPMRAENVPPGARQGNENAAVAEGQAGAENENQPLIDGNQPVENENPVEPGAVPDGNRWWGIVKEIQMIVFGFITSLLPGFDNID